MKKFKIVVTYVEAGMGHIVSARAVSDALKRLYSDEVEVEDCYLLRDSKSKLLVRHERYLVGKVKSFYKHKHYLNFFFFLAGRILSPRLTLRLVHAVRFSRQRRQSAKLLMQKQADMVLTTHYSILHYAVYAKRSMGADFITAHYNPDPCVHEWNDDRADLMVVNNGFALSQATEKLKFTKENCALGKFALRSAVLNCKEDKFALRKKYGIEQNSFTVVMADGAYASAKLMPVARRLLATGRAFTLLIIAGVNGKVYDCFEKEKQKGGLVDIKVYGFTENAHELYKASDLFITKAGPNALIDCAFVGTPVMVTYHSGNIELCSRRIIVEECGTGVVARSISEAESLFLDFYDHPEKLAPYRENCRRFASSKVDSDAVAKIIVNKLRARENHSGGIKEGNRNIKSQ